jgi:hypothetical protein
MVTLREQEARASTAEVRRGMELANKDLLRKMRIACGARGSGT